MTGFLSAFQSRFGKLFQPFTYLLNCDSLVSHVHFVCVWEALHTCFKKSRDICTGVFT